MDCSSVSLTQRLRETRRKLFVQTLATSLIDCWFFFMTFAIVWVCTESLFFPKNPQWLGLTVIATSFLISTLCAIVWTIRTCPRPKETRVSTR